MRKKYNFLSVICYNNKCYKNHDISKKKLFIVLVNLFKNHYETLKIYTVSFKSCFFQELEVQIKLNAK